MCSRILTFGFGALVFMVLSFSASQTVRAQYTDDPEEMRKRYDALTPMDNLKWNCEAEDQLWKRIHKDYDEFLRRLKAERQAYHNSCRKDLNCRTKYDASVYHPALENAREVMKGIDQDHLRRMEQCDEARPDRSLNTPDTDTGKETERRPDRSLGNSGSTAGAKQGTNPDKYPKTADGDWDPRNSSDHNSPQPKKESSQNQNGDWQPPPSGVPCQSMIDQARSRIRIMANTSLEDNRQERINCGSSIACLKRAAAHFDQRTKEIREEDARLKRQIRDCQAAARSNPK